MVTEKQAAQSMSVSVSQVKKARRLNRARPDLGKAVLAGDLSLNEAYKQAFGQYKTISFRISEQQYEQLAAEAGKVNLSPAAWAQQIVLLILADAAGASDAATEVEKERT